MTKHDSKDEDIYYEGMGCKCMARYQGDCACDNVDWTPKEVYELRKKNAELESHNLGLTKTLVEIEKDRAIRDLKQQAKGLEDYIIKIMDGSYILHLDPECTHQAFLINLNATALRLRDQIALKERIQNDRY